MTNLLTTAEAASLVGRKATYFDNLRRAGKGPMYIRLGRNIRYAHEDILSYIATLRMDPKNYVKKARKPRRAAGGVAYA